MKKTSKILLALFILFLVITNVFGWLNYSSKNSEYENLKSTYESTIIKTYPKISDKSSYSSLEKYESLINDLDVRNYKLLIYDNSFDLPLFKQRDMSSTVQTIEQIVGDECKSKASVFFTIAYIQYPKIFIVYDNYIYETEINLLANTNPTQVTAAFIKSN